MAEEMNTDTPKMFHPFRSNNLDAWYPSNDAATAASIISIAWEDILRLGDLRKGAKDDYTRKLLFKYILIELKSVLERMDQLQPIVFAYLNSGSKSAIKDASSGITDRIKSAYKKYHSIRSSIEKELSDVRNEIGAHRRFIPLCDVTRLWNALDSEKYSGLFEILPELFGHLIKLDIYDWTRIHEPGTIEICCSGLDNDFSKMLHNVEPINKELGE